MTVNKERMELWAQALESEKYHKCVGNLKMNLVKGCDPYVMHCALGVGMAVAEAHGVGIPWADWGRALMPPQVARWYGLPYGNPLLVSRDEPGTSIMNANDNMRWSFWRIAQALRATYLKDES